MLNDPEAGPDTEAFTDLLTRLFNKGALIEQEPVDTGDGVLLFTSEIHLLDIAGRYPDDSMTVLASRLGITKGAISQTAKKLEEKGYLERINREGDNKTVLIRLTENGLRASGWHRAYHAAVNRRIQKHIAALDRRERDAVRNLLSEMEKIFDDCPETRRRITREMAEGHGAGNPGREIH